MREHALPQDVTSYRFHIIGNMTLKQFAEVAAGCVVGFFIYITNLPALIKWPLIFLFAALGAMAAFIPIEERPIDQWLYALFRALYRPTKFFWQKKVKVPEPFLFQPKTETIHLAKEVDLTPVRRQRVKEYLHSIHSPVEEVDDDPFLGQRITEVTALFVSSEKDGPVHATGASTLSATMEFAQISQENNQLDRITATQPVSPAFADQNSSSANEESPQDIIQTAAQSTLPRQSIQATPITWSISATDSVPNNTTQPQNTNTSASAISRGPANSQVEVPELQQISLAPKYAEKIQQTIQAPSLDSSAVYSDAQPDQSLSQAQATQTAVQNADLPFPNKPTEPNKLVGMILDKNNTPLAGAIMEVITADGMPARAVKTNMLGQFFITTPLSNGTYTLRAEKEGFQFPVQEITLAGTVLEPIEVKSI